MKQLGLNIVPRLSYAPENYILHQGVADPFYECISGISKEAFSLSYFVGKARAGKTHLSVKLFDLVAARGFFPRLMDGDQFYRFLIELPYFDSESISSTSTPSPGPNSFCSCEDVFIVDDGDRFFTEIKPGSSGIFVNAVELMRRAKASIIFLSRFSVDQLPCDEHIVSRLNPGAGFLIKEPSDNELPQLLRTMAAQRGIRLSERNVNFLMKKLERDLPALERYLERLAHLSQVLGKSIKFPLIFRRRWKLAQPWLAIDYS